MLNQKELTILANLRENARMSLTNMSKRTRIPVSTIFDKLKVQEEQLILKHTTLIDFTKLGYNTRANIMFKVDKESKEAMKEHLSKHPNVNNLYKINNGYDYMIECVFKHIKDMEEFIESLEEKFNVLEKHSYYIIDDIKRESFLGNAEMLGILPPQ